MCIGAISMFSLVMLFVESEKVDIFLKNSLLSSVELAAPTTDALNVENTASRLSCAKRFPKQLASLFLNYLRTLSKNVIYGVEALRSMV